MASATQGSAENIRTSPTLSVVIPTFGRHELVADALAALTRQTIPAGEFEVVVVVDGPDDETNELLEGSKYPYRLRSLGQAHAGRASACNAGIAVAVGQIVIVLDDDMLPAPTFLAAHQEAHRTQPRLGVLGAVPVRAQASDPPIARFIAAKFNAHLERLASPAARIGFRDFYTGNFSIRKSVLAEVGSFDESFRAYGNEDGELAIRLLKAGVRLVYSPEAIAEQRYTKDFASLARDNVAKGETAVILARKHPEALAELQLSRYHGTSRRRFVIRAVLLALTRVFPPTSAIVVRLMGWIEQLRPRRLHAYYAAALDYFYWVGAARAMRTADKTSRAS